MSVNILSFTWPSGAATESISRNSVRKYLLLLKEQDIASEKELADKAYNNDLLEHDADRQLQLTHHFTSCGNELQKTGVTRQLLWQEYLQRHPDGYSYSRYCYHLQQYFKQSDVSMHLEYTPGDMMMIDFAGKQQHYIDPSTGEQISCEVFVAIQRTYFL